jgi:hypothetical protein
MRKTINRETFWWRCDLCGCTGSSTNRAGLDGWTGVQLTLTLHRSVAPTCRGDAATIRVSLDGPIRAPVSDVQAAG